jgi:hypothetical protein
MIVHGHSCQEVCDNSKRLTGDDLVVEETDDGAMSQH